MKIKLSLAVLALAVFMQLALAAQANSIKALHPVCEYRINPVGIDVLQPRLSWQLHSEGQNVLQTAYEIRVAASVESLSNGNLIWATGKVKSDQSIHVEYSGPQVESMKRYYWQVRVWDNKGEQSRWTEPAFWEMGLLDIELWKASWITMDEKIEPEKSLPAQYYRKEFSIDKKVESARVYATSLGIYQLFLNGAKVSDQLFTPGFTSYHKRLQYQVYDVTQMLKRENAFGAMVGDGWYRGNMGWEGDKAYYGDQLALLIQLHINYSDGSSEVIVTNNDWKVSYGPILESDIYNGEKYDARLEHKGWTKSNFDDKKWKKSVVLEHPKEMLVASNSDPVKAIEEVKPIKIITTPKGELVIDLGQIIVGWVRMNVKGSKGDKVTLQFAEVLDKKGNFYTTNLRSADATDVYILSGEGEEVYEPYFTFHGFRYVKLEGYPGTPTLDAITGVVIHSDMRSTGIFETSDPLINQLQSNIQWAQRGNFLDIPTDCPQRDERVGWTGDAQVFSQTAAFNYNVAPFFTKWLADLSVDQLENGEVPNIIPDILNNKLGGTTGWADAAVIIPWNMYKAYGDVRLLEQQYGSMKAWVDYMKVRAGEDYLWNENRWHWGDWLAFNSNRPDYTGSFTEKDLIATAYFKHSTDLLSKAALVLGNEADAEKYKVLAQKVRDAFIAEYVTPNGRLVSHTQTAYALALTFDLLPVVLVENSSVYFAQNVEKFGHLTTGFLGTPLLCPSLSKIGRDDLAFQLLNRKTYPSWLYPVTQGATTIWERWDTQRPDGSIIEGMNSFNHYAYGAIGDWLYQHVAGLQIDPLNPGYKHVLLSPHPGGGLAHARAEIESMYGKVKSGWETKDGLFIYRVTVPANTTATVTLPGAAHAEVKMNSKTVSEPVVKSGNDRILNIGSGDYVFEYKIVTI